MKYYKLYTDGCHYLHNNIAGYGGYILNDKDEEILSFSEIIENPKDFSKHESIAIIDGLKKALSQNIEYLECFTDEKALAEMCNFKDEKNKEYVIQPYVHEIYKLISQFKSVNFNHIPRDLNKKADKLSRKKVTEYFNSENYKSIAENNNKLFIDNLMFFSKAKLLKNENKFKKAKNELKTNYIFELKNTFEKNVTVKSCVEFKKIIKNDSGYEIIEEHIYELNPAKVLNEYVKTINECFLKEEDLATVGLIFIGRQSSMIEGILRNEKVIGKKNLPQLLELKNNFSRFETVILSNSADILNFIDPNLNTMNNKILPKTKEDIFELLKIIGDNEFETEENVKKYADVAISKDNSVDIQKKYFSEFLKIAIKESNLSRITERELIKEKVFQIRNDLINEGIKFKF